VKKEKDRLIQHYDTILKESALLATFAGILFGFLSQISINTPRYFTYFDKAILLVALFSITIAASLFAMPVIYHHLEYPYTNRTIVTNRTLAVFHILCYNVHHTAAPARIVHDADIYCSFD
jgi:hypothetical protein